MKRRLSLTQFMHKLNSLATDVEKQQARAKADFLNDTADMLSKAAQELRQTARHVQALEARRRL